ncbi:MAG: glycoside hydrolase family 9 protein [Muribaculaceae bacterium]|nr:glycoside hydrolase family 9 protein [Muribaculaceae bacterium]
MKRALLILLVSLFNLTINAESWIRINQLGYIPNSTKVAVLLNKEQINITSFQIINAFTSEVVFSSENVTASGKLGGMKSTFRLNFSDFNLPGTYYIKANECKSAIFPINGSVYNGTADFILNYMRQQRCGYNPYFKELCHQNDGYIAYHPTKTGQMLDVRGGWHDAADYLQYTTTSANAIYQMMFAYKQNPNAFGDYYKADGHKGANGIPDIVDEIYWGLDWLNRMNPEKGELYNQIADDRDHIGMKIPSQDTADYGWGSNNGRPVYFCTGEPQQRGKFLNATMGVASTAGKFASDFALGAEILKPFYPEFAEIIGAKAADAYQIGVDKPGNCQTASVLAPYIYEEDNWVDDMQLGAMELYNKTKDIKYLNQAIEYGRREPITPWMGADSARHYQWYPFMNMGHYLLAKEGNDRIKKEFIRNIKTGIERTFVKAKESPFLYGIPSIWCSNNLTTAMLTQCILYRQLTGDKQFEEMEGSLRDWLFGCNPWGTSMIVELPLSGTYPHQPHSAIVSKKLGNTTGGLVDGPVYSSIFNSLKGVNIVKDIEGDIANNYEEFQPGIMVYHDNIHDYSTNEPTMDGTACLAFPLSAYQNEGLNAVASHNDKNVYRDGGIERTDTTQKRICLVFTAADKADGAEKIISTLKKNNIKGGFFFTGEFFETFPSIITRLINDGHYVGGHSYGHLLYMPWENPDSLLISQDEFNNDIIKIYSLMRKFGINKEDAPYFIPPFEYYNSKISSWANKLGLQVIDFTPGTLTSQDYTTPDMGKRYYSSKTLYDNLMKAEKSSASGLNGHLLLIHFGTDDKRTDKFYNLLPTIIKNLKKKGYQFVSIEEAIGLNLK